MDAQLKKGLLEVCVLAALQKEESYGYKIISDLAGVIEISESTLYPILKRLEKVLILCYVSKLALRVCLKLFIKGYRQFVTTFILGVTCVTFYPFDLHCMDVKKTQQFLPQITV